MAIQWSQGKKKKSMPNYLFGPATLQAKFDMDNVLVTKSFRGFSRPAGSWYTVVWWATLVSMMMTTGCQAFWTCQNKVWGSDMADNAKFGSTLAVWGAYMVVGAPGQSANGPNSGSAFVFHRTLNTTGSSSSSNSFLRSSASASSNSASIELQYTWTQQAKLLPANGKAEDSYGQSVAIYDTAVVVGSKAADYYQGSQLMASDVGSVFVYRYNQKSETWPLEQQIFANDTMVYGYEFGSSVSIYQTTLAIGCDASSVGRINMGAVYLFERTAVNLTAPWTFYSKLYPSVPVRGLYFGFAVALWNDTLLVTAYGDSTQGAYSGSVFIFQKQPSTQQPRRLSQQTNAGLSFVANRTVSNSSQSSTNFTTSNRRSMSSNIFARQPTATPQISATRQSTTPEASAISFVWVQKQILYEPSGAAYNSFGISLAMQGDRVVIGASFRNVGGNINAGAAYVYQRRSDRTKWDLQEMLTAQNPKSGDQFGSSVAVKNNLIVIGAKLDSHLLTGFGSAYTFQGTTSSGITTWTQRQQLLPVDEIKGQSFGSAVAIGDSTIVIGAVQDEVNEIYSGSVYSFYDNGCRSRWSWLCLKRLQNS